MITLVYSVSAGSGSVLASSRAAQPAEGIFDLMGEAVHQIPRRDLLIVLELFLTEAALIIHRRQLHQNSLFRPPLRGQRQDLRPAVHQQRHFVIGNPLAGAQTFAHQLDIEGKIAQQFGQRGAEQLT